MNNIFEAKDFSSVSRLLDVKYKKNIKVSVGIPTLNEERTIINIVRILKKNLIEKYPLVDELAVFDCGSVDKTVKILQKEGILVYSVKDILPKRGAFQGKGEALWKSLYCLTGDIIAWIDADIENFASHFVTGLIGPLICYEGLNYVKGFFKRRDICRKRCMEREGGRVTELIAKPMIKILFPQLASIYEPLAGEYAGRRIVLERVPFHCGWGVETNLLIDISRAFGIETIAQTNLYYKMHRHRSLSELSSMSEQLLQLFLNRKGFTDTKLPERPAMASLPEYRKKFKRNKINQVI